MDKSPVWRRVHALIMWPPHIILGCQCGCPNLAGVRRVIGVAHQSPSLHGNLRLYLLCACSGMQYRCWYSCPTLATCPLSLAGVGMYCSGAAYSRPALATCPSGCWYVVVLHTVAPHWLSCPSSSQVLQVLHTVAPHWLSCPSSSNQAQVLQVLVCSGICYYVVPVTSVGGGLQLLCTTYIPGQVAMQRGGLLHGIYTS